MCMCPVCYRPGISAVNVKKNSTDEYKQVRVKVKTLMKIKCKDKRLKTMLLVLDFERARLLTDSLNESISGSNAMLGGSLLHWTMAKAKTEFL